MVDQHLLIDQQLVKDRFGNGDPVGVCVGLWLAQQSLFCHSRRPGGPFLPVLQVRFGFFNAGFDIVKTLKVFEDQPVLQHGLTYCRCRVENKNGSSVHIEVNLVALNVLPFLVDLVPDLDVAAEVKLQLAVSVTCRLFHTRRLAHSLD